MLAEGEWQLGALGALLGVLLPLLGAGVAWLLTFLARRADSDRKTSLDEWKEIVARQDLQIGALQEETQHCRQREAALRVAVSYLHGVCVRQGEAMRGAGMTVEAMRPLEELLPHECADEVRARQLAQGTALVRGEAKTARDNS